MINLYAKNLGWLFEDLKGLYRQTATDLITVSDEPDEDADGWICLRSWEAALSPDPERTVVQIHANDRRLISRTEENDLAIAAAAGLVLTNPAQAAELTEMGIGLRKPTLLRPIGAPRCFGPNPGRGVDRSPVRIGWVGRDTGPNKGLDLYAETVRRVARRSREGVIPVLIGDQLRGVYDDLRRTISPNLHPALYFPRDNTPFSAYRGLYNSLDVLLVTSRSEAGPLPLFEALACGTPVVSTDCGWASRLLHGLNGTTVSFYDPAPLAEATLVTLDSAASPEYISTTTLGFVLERWMVETAFFALHTLREDVA